MAAEVTNVLSYVRIVVAVNRCSFKSQSFLMALEARISISCFKELAVNVTIVTNNVGNVLF
jgi:hypothetical protein